MRANSSDQVISSRAWFRRRLPIWAMRCASARSSIAVCSEDDACRSTRRCIHSVSSVSMLITMRKADRRWPIIPACVTRQRSLDRMRPRRVKPSITSRSRSRMSVVRICASCVRAAAAS